MEEVGGARFTAGVTIAEGREDAKKTLAEVGWLAGESSMSSSQNNPNGASPSTLYLASPLAPAGNTTTDMDNASEGSGGL